MTAPDLYVDLYAALFALRRDEPMRYDNEFITGQLERAVNGPSPEQYAANLRLFDPARSQPLPPPDEEDDAEANSMLNDDLRGYSSQQAAQDFLDAEVGAPGKHTVVPDPDGTWRIQLGKPPRPPRTAAPATVPFKPKLQGSIRDAIDAAMHLGDSESERITGPGGLSGATTEQLNQIMALARQRGWKGQPARFSQDQQTRDWNDEGRWTAGKIDAQHPRYQAFLQSPERQRRLAAAQAEHRRVSATENEQDPEVTMIRREIAQGKA